MSQVSIFRLNLLRAMYLLIVVALPMKMSLGLDEYASGVLFACVMGIVLTPIAVPWKYVFHNYVKTAGAPWRSTVNKF